MYCLLCQNLDFSANSSRKIAALQISRILVNLEVVNPPKLANTCYSLVAPNYGISIAAVYEAHDDEIIDLKIRLWWIKSFIC